MKILAVGAHPGDVEIGCFGALARCVERGDNVVICSLTNGNLGHSSIGKGRLRAVRLAEAAKSAAVIGASFCTLDVDDLALDSRDETTRRKLLSLVRSIKPDLVITHSQEDSHSDQSETAKLLNYTRQCASLAQVECEQPPITNRIIVYEMEMVDCSIFIPTEFVNIETTVEMKIEALSCHMSQIDYRMERSQRDLLNEVRVWAEYRGLQCGYQYGEAFRLSKLNPFLAERVLP